MHQRKNLSANLEGNKRRAGQPMSDDIAKELTFEEVAKNQIRKHEGFRNDIYLDSEGVLTGGWGHAFQIGTTLPRNIWEQIFENDFLNKKAAADNFIWQRRLHDIGIVREIVLLDMIFNMGVSGVNKFVKMIVALDKRDYKAAAAEMIDSKWATQVGDRAKDLARQMESGIL